MMRKHRDFDAELKALTDKARDLKSRKVQQLSELVIATGADSLNTEELAGALIVLTETKDTGKREAWARRGAAFFQGRARRNAPTTDRNTDGPSYLPRRTCALDKAALLVRFMHEVCRITFWQARRHGNARLRSLKARRLSAWMSGSPRM
jgi:DNA-binding protein H-NS